VVVTLALRALLTAALLNFVHGRAPAAQGNNLTSQDQPTVSEVNAVIRQVLADRIAAKDIPDSGLLRGTQRIAVRSDGLGIRLTLGKDALPALEGYELRLISTAEAQAEAERTQANVHFIAIERLAIRGDAANLWIGVDFAMPSNPKSVKLCCCSRSLEYRRAADRWVFARWGEGFQCS
jgi:hypothetical protein